MQSPRTEFVINDTRTLGSVTVRNVTACLARRSPGLLSRRVSNLITEWMASLGPDVSNHKTGTLDACLRIDSARTMPGEQNHTARPAAHGIQMKLSEIITPFRTISVPGYLNMRAYSA